ncbi:hypothetical protein [Synechococcus sp. EJ6-Ellesmere]|uniref:hypothetical protein n=1 Tax=Synechococcus sp. EJ6-Ellesmere TaxID=2823734 RepID=UPI0020CC6B7E|nr:hypothetical protein [Synechococcus sp. EJ6-Ellesmere]MCP9823985.1 hypothetical protein [Synechococcus sp. EJ6-Ellesmere]
MTRLLSRHLPLLLTAIAGCLVSHPAAAWASPAGSNLAVLLQAAGGQPLGLYDGVRFVRINATDGTRITVTINCEQELWRVARIEPRTGRADFRDDLFQSAAGIGRSRWCTTPVRTME